MKNFRNIILEKVAGGKFFDVLKLLLIFKSSFFDTLNRLITPPVIFLF